MWFECGTGNSNLECYLMYTIMYTAIQNCLGSIQPIVYLTRPKNRAKYTAADSLANKHRTMGATISEFAYKSDKIQKPVYNATSMQVWWCSGDQLTIMFTIPSSSLSSQPSAGTCLGRSDGRTGVGVTPSGESP